MVFIVTTDTLRVGFGKVSVEHIYKRQIFVSSCAQLPSGLRET